MIENMGVYVGIATLELVCFGLGRALCMYLLVGVGCFVYLISATYGLPLLAYSMTSHPFEESMLSGVNIFWLHKSVADGLHFPQSSCFASIYYTITSIHTYIHVCTFTPTNYIYRPQQQRVLPLH